MFSSTIVFQFLKAVWSKSMPNGGKLSPKAALDCKGLGLEEGRAGLAPIEFSAEKTLYFNVAKSHI